MSDKKHRKELKRQEKLRKRAKVVPVPKDLFFDGMDSYAAEYDVLVAHPPVHGLLGVFSLDNETYYGTTVEEKANLVGFRDYSAVRWESGIKKDDHHAYPEATATGFAGCLTDPGGRHHPIIFIRQDVKSSGDGPPEARLEIGAAIRLLVLLHEIGHADDMSKQINFNHQAKTMDLIAAEAYTHKYVLNYARKKNYRIALQFYIQELEQYATKPEIEEYVRAAAQRVLGSAEMPQFRQIVSRTSLEIGRHKEAIDKRILRRISEQS